MRCLLLILVLFFAVGSSPAKEAPSLDSQTWELINNLAHKPELMNLDYLQHFIGRPQNERSQQALAQKQYFWYDPDGGVRRQLYQTEHPIGKVVESRLIMELPDSKLTIGDIERLYGKTARRFYEYGAHATLLYSLVPNTQLVFVVPRTTFRVGQVKINYRGPALPEPAAADMTLARARLSSQMEEMIGKEQWDQVVPHLLRRLKDNPRDGEAHYQLGRAYARQGHIHEAIVQYKSALAMTAPTSATALGDAAAVASGSGSAAPASVSGEELRNKCLEGLRELRVLPVPEEQQERDLERRKKFKIVQKGQRIRAQGKEKVPEPRKETAQEEPGNGH